MSILSPIGGMLGIGNDHGDYYQYGNFQSKGTTSLAEMLDAARGGNMLKSGQALMGGSSLADALKGLNADETNALGSSGIYGNLVAQQQVQNDPLMSGLFNKGGSRDQALNEEQRLSSQGFKLQPEDVEAYGQASGDIARMFGQNEQSLSSALANRGLAAAPSGAAGAQFSGLQGNKNEMLGQMQMQIANDRMNNTMQRLQQTRNYINQLTSQGQAAENNMFSHNQQAMQNNMNMADMLAKNERGNYQTVEQARQASMQSQQGAEKKNLGDAFANGMYKGVETQTEEGVNGTVAKDTAKGATKSGGGGGGLMAMFSDRDLKTDIEELFSLPAYSYRYKNPAHGIGRHASVMAQDLEGTELGRSAVIETPEGKMVDYGKLCGLMFAQIALLTQEIKALKEAR